MKAHLLRPQSSKVLPLKPGVGQNIVMLATPTAKDFFLAYSYLPSPFNCIFSKTSDEILQNKSSLRKWKMCYSKARAVRRTVGTEVMDIFFDKLPTRSQGLINC